MAAGARFGPTATQAGQIALYSHQSHKACFFGANSSSPWICSIRSIVSRRIASSCSTLRVELRRCPEAT